jgi:RNA polymerase sigma-70 factor (ECF subfamily)
MHAPFTEDSRCQQTAGGVGQLERTIPLSGERTAVPGLIGARAVWRSRACVDTLIARTEADECEAGFGARVAENQRRVFQIAYGILGNSADAEEVAQEAFLRAYQKFQSLREAEKFRAWVNQIAFRLALNRQRGLRRRLTRETAWHAVGTGETVDGTRNAEERVLVERLRNEIEGLPEKLRRVLQLSIVEDMDATDVGVMLGIPAGTVRSRLHTARKLLLEAMK